VIASFFTRLFRWHRPGSPDEVDWQGSFQERDLIPVWADWVGGFGLTPDHSVVFIEHGLSGVPDPVEEPHLRHITLFLASQKFPELSHLQPQRQPGDPTCPSCGGSGVYRGLDGRPAPEWAICFCGGLGWLPAGYDAVGPARRD
jgi:hypothetical protein